MSRVIGIQDVDYTSKRTGNRVLGKKIFFIDEIRSGGVGYKADSIFVKLDMANDIHIDDNIDIIYNKFGSVIDVRLEDY